MTRRGIGRMTIALSMGVLLGLAQCKGLKRTPDGDACTSTVSGKTSCSVDHTKELTCADGKFSTLRTCKGPKQCDPASGTVHCDSSVADVGDPCVVDPGDANNACTADKTFQLGCDEATSKFKMRFACRGPKGCTVNKKGHFHCDQSVARAGDTCNAKTETSTCSDDGTQVLQCSADSTWTKERDCPKKGCQSPAGKVSCE